MNKSHSAYRLLVERYSDARDAWASSQALRETAELLGIDERAYCDAFIANSPIIWTSSTAVMAPLTLALCDAAFEEAAPFEVDCELEDEPPYEVLTA